MQFPKELDGGNVDFTNLDHNTLFSLINDNSLPILISQNGKGYKKAVEVICAADERKEEKRGWIHKLKDKVTGSNPGDFYRELSNGALKDNQGIFCLAFGGEKDPEKCLFYLAKSKATPKKDQVLIVRENVNFTVEDLAPLNPYEIKLLKSRVNNITLFSKIINNEYLNLFWLYVSKFGLQDVDLNGIQNNHHSALCMAIKVGSLKLVRFLIENCNVNINSACKTITVDMEVRVLRAPLFTSVCFGDHEIAKYLITKGADINKKSLVAFYNNQGEFTEYKLLTPLDLAWAQNDEKMAQLLLDNGASFYSTRFGFFQTFKLRANEILNFIGINSKVKVVSNHLGNCDLSFEPHPNLHKYYLSFSALYYTTVTIAHFWMFEDSLVTKFLFNHISYQGTIEIGELMRNSGVEHNEFTTEYKFAAPILFACTRVLVKVAKDMIDSKTTNTSIHAATSIALNLSPLILSYGLGRFEKKYFKKINPQENNIAVLNHLQ